nr:lytic transglycosylase domain-containing protein [uncultured Rhodopila sp.]
MKYNFHHCIPLLACILTVAVPAASAQPADNSGLPTIDACQPGIIAAERQFALPPKLLQTIGIVESGRPDPTSGRVAPWPWTINVGGVGHFFATKASAIEAVEDLRKAGTNSIDVGCMQINLVHHPDAFASLDEAFDPPANTRYGARFLAALYRETGNWPQAAAAYHSRTQDLGVSYETRVMAIWPLAGRFPDPTLALRSRALGSEPNLSGYTPEYVAELKRMRTDFARLSALSAPAGRSDHRAPGSPDYSRYTPAFAAEVRAMARSPAGHATAAAYNPPLRPHQGVAYGSQYGRLPGHMVAGR